MTKSNTHFHRCHISKLRKMNVVDIEAYYRALRKYEYENGKKIRTIKLKAILHPVMYRLIQIDRILKRETIRIIRDDRIISDKPVIYAATHIGGNDVERVAEIVREHCYIMIGDMRNMYVNEAGIALNLNGLIALDTRNKEDRKIAQERAIEVLNQGCGLLVFPEGAYNVFENLPVMDIFPGIINMAQTTGCQICPIAIEQYGSEFVACVGKNIDVSEFSSVNEARESIRDILATLKWQIWESQAVAKYSEYTEEYRNSFRQSIVDRGNHGGYAYTLQDIYETMYHDKAKVSADEVFECLKKLNFNKK